MCDIELKEDISDLMRDTMIGVLSGDINPLDVLVELQKIGKSIPDILFYKNIECMLNGLDKKGTIKRKVGKKLAESNYGADSGFMLLKYLESYEYPEKGKCMAYLLDSLSRDFISVDECLLFCKLIKDLSVSALMFLKKNVHKSVLYHITEENLFLIKELKNNALMYDACDNGIAFELEAYYLDKFALSYDDDKYGYSSKRDGIPEDDKLPKVVVNLTTNEVVSHR